MKIKHPLIRTRQPSTGSWGWLQMHTHMYVWGQRVHLHRWMWPYPRPDIPADTHQCSSTCTMKLAMKHVCHHLTSERRTQKQLFQSHQAFFFFFSLRFVSKSVQESKCWTKINCTWSPHTRHLVRSPHTETLQAKPNQRSRKSHTWNFQLLNLPAEECALWLTRAVALLGEDSKGRTQRPVSFTRLET